MEETAKAATAPRAGAMIPIASAGRPTEAPLKPLDTAREVTVFISDQMTLLEEISHRVIYLVTGKDEGMEAKGVESDGPPDGIIPAYLASQRSIHARICKLLNDMNALVDDLS